MLRRRSQRSGSNCNVPGVITAGTFYQDGKRVFWDVHHPEKTIVIDLQHNELIVEVEDPEAAVDLIQKFRASRCRDTGRVPPLGLHGRPQCGQVGFRGCS